MTADTNRILERLAAGVEPVRPLATPWRRAAAWCGVSLAYVGAVAVTMSVRRDVISTLSDSGFVVEQMAALLTGVAAATAALATTIPGYSRKILLLPLLPLAVWLGNVGQSCVQDWMAIGPQNWAIAEHWPCLVVTIVAGALPSVAMVLMLRRGAPLTPGLTLALGGLAAGALGHFGSRLVHPLDASVVVLVWHIGTVLGLCLLARLAGRHFLTWRSLVQAAD
ncbi:MAG: hypothetical protein A3G76_15635 [Acidobacteria bacterium RIFCSPLOWO2_12_FULL_65_11]|nr:MAG: hypothetical protein A3H95_17390 [Acidobacteria bacterium RIFCSPLOWO2_02_FULL_64_15]OFW30697.1 MAG: hypothetical protein A3G76_15635 [Acidobacteria bacterium RIFCSPLOWO2_12_FULL_65_11]